MLADTNRTIAAGQRKRSSKQTGDRDQRQSLNHALFAKNYAAYFGRGDAIGAMSIFDGTEQSGILEFTTQSRSYHARIAEQRSDGKSQGFAGSATATAETTVAIGRWLRILHQIRDPMNFH